MTPHAIEATYTEKLNRICELLEELVLDAVITTLGRITRDKTIILRPDQTYECYQSECTSRVDIPF